MLQGSTCPPGQSVTQCTFARRREARGCGSYDRVSCSEYRWEECQADQEQAGLWRFGFQFLALRGGLISRWAPPRQGNLVTQIHMGQGGSTHFGIIHAPLHAKFALAGRFHEGYQHISMKCRKKRQAGIDIRTVGQ